MTPEPNWTLESAPSAEPLTAADLVGRVARTTRLHWKELILVFLPFALVNEVAGQTFLWLPDHLWSGYPHWFLQTLGIVAVLVTLTCRYQIAIRMLAVQSLMCAQFETMKSAVSDANVRKWKLALLLVSPVVLIELSSTSLSLAAQVITDDMERGGQLLPQSMAPLAVFAIFLVYGVTLLPYIWLCIFNSFFSAIIIGEKASLVAACKRELYLVFRRIGFVWNFLWMSTFVYVGLAIPASLIAILDAIPEFLNADLKEPVSLALQIVQAIVYAPVGALWFASISVGGAMLHQYLRVEVEGADIRAQVEQFRE